MSRAAAQSPRETLPPARPALARTAPLTGGQPNIVIINCDDLGYADVGAYGATAIATPNIDALAGGGTRFTDFYACNALCTPSRFGLLTGRYPDRVGMGWLILPQRIGPREGTTTPPSDRADRFWWHVARFVSNLHLMDYAPEPGLRGIPPDEVTIADALKQAGYRTGMVGKWHLGEFPVHPEYNPVRHGFDFFYGVPHSNDMKDFALYCGEECLDPDFEEMERLTGLYTAEALEFVREAVAGRSSPFFLYFAHTYPHQPLHASERFRGKSKAGLYGDAVEEIDWSVGELVRTLAELGQLENTLIVFTSDNGPWYNGNPGGLRGRKGQSYEGGFRIPMIAHWPGHIPGGRVCREPAMNIDWLPTCCSLAGVELPTDRAIDGRDIAPLLLGETESSPHDALFFYHNYELEAVRMGDWKYIRDISTGVWPIPLDKYWKSPGSRQAPWLYNLRTDPTESYNLRPDYPELAERLDAVVQAWEQQLQAARPERDVSRWIPARWKPAG